MHFVILCLLCAAFATLPQLLHNNALCSSIAEEPTVTNSSHVADGMLISKMLLHLLSPESNSVTCRAGPCFTRHSFEQSIQCRFDWFMPGLPDNPRSFVCIKKKHSRQAKL